MINSEDVLELLKYGERICLECKDSRNEISNVKIQEMKFQNLYGKHIRHLPIRAVALFCLA